MAWLLADEATGALIGDFEARATRWNQRCLRLTSWKRAMLVESWRRQRYAARCTLPMAAGPRPNPLDAQERASALTMAEQALKLSAMSWSGQ